MKNKVDIVPLACEDGKPSDMIENSKNSEKKCNGYELIQSSPTLKTKMEKNTQIGKRSQKTRTEIRMNSSSPTLLKTHHRYYRYMVYEFGSMILVF